MVIFHPAAGRQIRILILEILQCIPVVKILIFLDFAKTISFLDGHYLVEKPAFFLTFGLTISRSMGEVNTHEAG